MDNKIKIVGARVNNLKNIDIDIPLNQIVTIAGPSGSGKSSLAFHTLFTESKRRFLNSFPTYLKFFSERPAPVDVDLIEPVLPVFGLPQINPVVGARSVVSDLMNLTENIQNLYGNFSVEKCPTHKVALEKYTIEQFLRESTKIEERTTLTIFTDKTSFITYLKDSPFPSRSMESYEAKGICDFDKNHNFWELARLKGKNIRSIDKKLETYKNLKLPLYVLNSDNEEILEVNLDKNSVCPKCDYEGLSSQNVSYFSPYNALGACSECNGFGAKLEYDEEKLLLKNLSVNEDGVKLLTYKRFGSLIEDLKKELRKEKISCDKPIKSLPKKFYKILYEGQGNYLGFNEIFKYLESKKYKPSVRIFVRGIQKELICNVCEGSRVNKLSHNMYLFEKSDTSYLELWGKNVENLLHYFSGSKAKLIQKNKSSEKLVDKVVSILSIADGIGLGHLDLTRKVKTVSAGEYQRLLLLKYLSYEGTGALFIFDEPSLGLGLAESKVLLKSFRNLVELGNSVLLVEHSEFFHKNSDYYIEMGPQSGKKGGEVLYTGKYKAPEVVKLDLKPLTINPKKRSFIHVEKPAIYNHEYKDVRIPINEVNLASGNSGSGKTSVLVNVLAQGILNKLDKPTLNVAVGKYKALKVPKGIEDVLVVDANINRYSSRSTVGSMTGLFGIVRKHFLKTAYAKSMGLKDGHLSANSDLGKCPNCEGKGVTIVEMQFLEDIILTCEDCNGNKIKPLYSSLTDGSMTVSESYNLPIGEVLEKVTLTPKYRRILDYMRILKIDYLSLDRPVKSLSGGEKQRLYLLSKLQTKIEKTLIVIENVSFGLSRVEVIAMCEFLQGLVGSDNTVIIIDKNETFKKISTNQIIFS
jgi:excinuclease ABC subunit A